MNLLKTAALFLVTGLAVAAAEARTVSFKCEPSNQPTLNRFSGSGSVEISRSKAEGPFAATFALGGRPSSSTDTGLLKTKGNARVFPAGTFGVNEVLSLKLQSQHSDNQRPVHLTFNLGINNAIGSTLTVNGIPYLAHCFEVQ